MMIGKKIGKWTVLQEVKVIQKRTAIFKHYECECECGIKKIVRVDGLRNGRSSQCRQCSDKLKYIDYETYVGKKFGKWEVLTTIPTQKTQRKVVCRCECGFEQIISATRLKHKRTSSCIKCNMTIHGMEGTTTYNTWRCMMARCYKKNNQNYKTYGNRGIIVYKGWHSFENFYKDMGERPKGLQLDRINNDGNYEPGNCRWVTPKENSNNKRNNKAFKSKKNLTIFLDI